MRSSTDVLVVGAGPVGLLLSCELQRQNVDHLLIEKVQERPYFCKALGVTPRTLEIFESLGIVEEAIDAGVWLAGWTSFENGVQTGAQDLDVGSFPYGFLSLPQYDTERILEGCLRRHGGTVQRGCALAGFTDGPDGVEARVVDAAGTTQTVRCRWLAGCDGARSTVRRGLGLEFAGDQYPMTFVLGDVEIEWNQPRGRTYRFQQIVEGTLRNAMVAVPVRGSARRYRLSMGGPDPAGDAGSHELGAETHKPPTLADLLELAEPMLPPGTPLSNLRWSSRYRISHRIVPQYSIGNVFLAGDAAHIHPPIGGLGMNTGLQDAHNLGWKLALAARGLAGPGLLSSYSAERHPVGLDVVTQTSRAMDKLIAGGWKPEPATARESQLFIDYRGSAWVRDELSSPEGINPDVPRAGDRVPDAAGLGRPFVAKRLRLRERLEKGQHVLIGYTASDRVEADQRAFAALLDVLRNRLGELAAGFAIVAAGGDGGADGELIPLLVDTVDAFRQAYGAGAGMAWLIRPDGHLAWHSDRPDAEQLRRFLDQTISGNAVTAGANPGAP